MALKFILRLWIQKRRGRNFLAYPTRQAFALPIYQDKQLSQPTPIAYYIMTYAQYPHGHIFAYRYNTPGMDASLRYLLVNQSCEVWRVEDNVQKTSFSCFLMKYFAATNLQNVAFWSTKSIMSWPTHPFRLAESTAKVVNYFGLSKSRVNKNAIYASYA